MKVYDGSKAYWKECDKTAAINAYGKSKEEAESYIQVSRHSLHHKHSQQRNAKINSLTLPNNGAHRNILCPARFLVAHNADAYIFTA